MRDLDEEYDELIDQLEAVIAGADSAERAARVKALRRRIEDVVREQLGLGPRMSPVDRTQGSSALN